MSPRHKYLCFLFEEILTNVSWAQIHALSIWRQFDPCLLGTNAGVFYLRTIWPSCPRHKYMCFLFENILTYLSFAQIHVFSIWRHFDLCLLGTNTWVFYLRTPLWRRDITWRHTTLKKESSSTCRFSFVLASSMIIFSVNWWVSQLTCRSRKKLSKVITKAVLSSISLKRRT